MKYESEVREEMGQLETLLAASKRDYELLRIEFERKAAADEQAAPLAKLGCLTSLSLSLSLTFSLLLSPPPAARELQVTVESLMKTTGQLKSEVERWVSLWCGLKEGVCCQIQDKGPQGGG